MHKTLYRLITRDRNYALYNLQWSSKAKEGKEKEVSWIMKWHWKKMLFGWSAGRRRIMPFRVFQGWGRKLSLAFHEGTGREIYLWHLFHVRTFYPVSGLCHLCRIFFGSNSGRQAQWDDYCTSWNRRMIVMNPSVAERNSMNEYVHIQNAQEVWH